MDPVSILIGALIQLAAEYGGVQPLSEIARNIVRDKRHHEAFSSAIRAAYSDLQTSEHSQFAASLLDEHYLSLREVTHEILKATTVGAEVNYDRLQALYASHGLGGYSPDARPALRYLVGKIREHAADRDTWFRELYGLQLQIRLLDVTERNLETSEEQRRLQERTVALLEELNQRHSAGTEANVRGTYIPAARCRITWGRDNLVELVLAAIRDPKHSPVVSLSGGPGYGKTEVARQVAQSALAQNRFADVLWVKARQTELIDGRISSGKAVAFLSWPEFLNDLAVELASPIDRVRAKLRRDPFLIVLDNAETSDVGAILSGITDSLRPSRLLLTSRLATEAPFVSSIRVTGLEEKWSMMLLRNEGSYKSIPILMQCADEDLHNVHTLACGAPLALHFVVGRVLHDRALDPVFRALQKATDDVAEFYRFSLEEAWERINKPAKFVLRYMGYMTEASVTRAELEGTSALGDSELSSALTDLERWSLIEAVQDSQGKVRYDLHPWIRTSVRTQLVDDWKPAIEDVEQIVQWKLKQLQDWKFGSKRSGH